MSKYISEINKIVIMWFLVNYLINHGDLMPFYVLSSLLWCPLRFPHKDDVRFIFISSCLLEGSCLIYLTCVCLHIVVFFLHLVYPMLPVSPFWLPLRYPLTFIYFSCNFFISRIFKEIFVLIPIQFSILLLFSYDCFYLHSFPMHTMLRCFYI